MTQSPSRSGVFSASTDKRLEAFGESISFDHRLFRHDIRGSIAHARMLAKQQLLTEEEFQTIEQSLREIETEIEQGKMPFRNELEDIHMHIESRLIELIGDTGRKLHTARSRNDQVNTDFRMWVREALDTIDALLQELQRAFLSRCDGDFDIILPAYTHLQRAQPVLAPHYWLCYIEKYQRDRERLADCRKRVNVCGLGAAACAGTTLPIDRDATARELDFERVAANSIDVSSDRDFVLEAGFVLAMIAEHLSGWAEEWILWSTVEFNFIQLPHQFCTGSSIMPQKVNPDTLELTRGKSARVLGNLQTLMILVKGLPLAYNRDLQEDKPPLFDSFETVRACLELAIPIVEQSVLQRKSIASRLDQGYLDATTLMEHLMIRGIPQRTAHHLVGTLVGMAQESGVRLADLTDAQLKTAHPELDESVREVLGVEKAVKAYQSYGSSSPDQVRSQIHSWREQLQ
ncbi:argininosuccinate lyase [Aureliella helgolandensis]|uniref:Argininosuccinate lyase n=1 Tax=Aureliella helgolandensis TaxID=2527968 RepID=A0A518GHA4_9BACT|nr:argininosuccinate lyase [Aureliella helgolandensis]QDV27963.1 Argininosuccinate lyase [Aureliella helgolandensis]